MKKILDRWYVSLVLLPLIINYFTDLYKIPSRIEKSGLWVLFVSIVLIIVGIEYLRLYAELKALKYRPKESDKKIIKELLETLNVKLFEEEISGQNSWNNYNGEAFHNTLAFKSDSALVSNKTSDKRLNRLIKEFRDALQVFHDYASDKLFGSKNGWNELEFAKENEARYEAAKTQSVEMDRLTGVAHVKLENLLDHLRKYNYLEESHK